MTDLPTVSMLWESVDPAERLVTRFGFGSAGAAAGWVMDALQSHWGLAVTGCERLVMSSWNVMAWVTVGERRLIAKWSALPQLFGHLVDAARVTLWLGTSGIPVAAPIRARDGRVLVEVGDNAGHSDRRLLGLIPAIDGGLLDLTEPVQIRQAGEMLAKVHKALARYPNRFGDGRTRYGEQLVHNDFRSANILHDGKRITAVLDMEEVRYATRVADLAKAAVLLGTRYHDWGPTMDEQRRTFVTAYNDHAPLTSAEQQALPKAIDAVLKNMGWS